MEVGVLQEAQRARTGERRAYIALRGGKDLFPYPIEGRRYA
jgi:hypothetical protein